VIWVLDIAGCRLVYEPLREVARDVIPLPAKSANIVYPLENDEQQLPLRLRDRKPHCHLNHDPMFGIERHGKVGAAEKVAVAVVEEGTTEQRIIDNSGLWIAERNPSLCQRLGPGLHEHLTSRLRRYNERAARTSPAACGQLDDSTAFMQRFHLTSGIDRRHVRR